MNDQTSNEKVAVSLNLGNTKGFSQQMARQLIDLMVDGVIVIGLDGKILNCNEAILRLHGVSRDEYVGKNIYDFTASEDQQRAIQEVSNVLEEKNLRIEVKALRKGGGIFDAEVNASLITDSSEKPLAILGVVRDITEWNKKKEELVQLSSAFKISTDGIAIGDINAKIVDVNDALLKMYGTEDRNDLIGKNAFDLIAPEDRKKALLGYKEVLKNGYHESREYNIVTKSGNRIFVEISATTLKDAHGQPTGFVSIVHDVTGRKRMKEVLRNSEENYRSIVELAPDIIATCDMKGIVTSFNTAGEKISGYSKNEVIGKHFLKVGHIRPRDWPKYLRMFSSVVRGKAPKLLEVVFYHKDGTPRFVEILVRLLRENDKPIGILAIMRDVTENRKAERAIRESQQKFERLFMSNPEAAVYWDSDFCVLDINPRFTELFKYSLEEIRGKRLNGFIVPKDKQEESRTLAKKSKKGYLCHDTVRKRKDGSLFPVSISVAPMIIEDQLIGYVGLYKDITSRQQMEERLKEYSEHLEELVRNRTEELLESEKRYSILVEEASDGVMITQDEKVVFANKKAAEMIDYSQNELVGLHLNEIVDEKHYSLVKERYEQRLKGIKIPAIYEIELKTKTGQPISIEQNATRINYQSRPAALVIVRDIQERKRLEEERLKLEKLATMGELATMVAHDLRNPLTSIRNACFYLKNTCSCNVNGKIRLEMMDIIEQETLLANNIINGLLDFAAKRPLQKKRQNINSIIENSLTESNIPKNIEVKRNFAKKTVAIVDEKQLQRVFSNLIRNAVQAMPNGGKLVVTTKETKDNVEIIFADIGAGISEENIGKLFTPLFTTKAKGIGLGLAICKNIVEQHNGTIEVKSKPSQGTTFTIRLLKKDEVAK